MNNKHAILFQYSKIILDLLCKTTSGRVTKGTRQLVLHDTDKNICHV